MHKQLTPRFTHIILVLICILGGQSSSVEAARAAIGISMVQPNTVLNNTVNQLTITGVDFIDGAVVSLQGLGNLSTTFVNSTTLTAILPAGVLPGIYNVVVTNPDASEAVLPNGLTVLQPTPTSTATATVTPTSTTTPTTTVIITPTTPPSGFERPLIVVQSYRTSAGYASPGTNLDLFVTLFNAGQRTARNILISFAPGSLLPLETGGIIAINSLTPEDRKEIKQSFNATWEIWGQSVATVDMTVTYLDPLGETYSEKFTLTIPVVQPKGVPATATPTPTVTPTPTAPPLRRPQLVITRYQSDTTPLQPGLKFELELQVQNVGNELAKNTTLIIGGGDAGSPGGTIEPGGISGAGGEFTNFAPLGSSNIQALGDIPPGSSKVVRQVLIVNVSTAPGAYPMPISFVYSGDRGQNLVDEQVITLLVYSLPSVDISFYRDPGPLSSGQPNLLPLQIVNLGRKSAVLGNMRVTAANSELSNNVVLVGALEAGGYFTLDATLIPFQSGPLDLLVTVDYTDDFNQSQQISQTIMVEVQEAFIPEGPLPGDGGEFLPPSPVSETLLQKIWRFFLGLIGLDSAPPTQEVSGEMPLEGPPVEFEQVPAAPIKVP